MLNIGSGYRAHPLDKQAIDNFYVLFDYNTETAPLSYTAVKKADLQGYKFVDNKINLTPSLKSNNGFYVELKDSDAGEKVLSKAITVDNVIYFSSFRPGSQSFDASCKPDTGATRLYAIKLTSPTDSVSIQDIKTPGIPSDPLIVTTPADTESGEEDGGLKILISTQLIDTGKKALLKKTYWRELK
jgi:type IV pilus assembly protein PilY1